MSRRPTGPVMNGGLQLDLFGEPEQEATAPPTTAKCLCCGQPQATDEAGALDRHKADPGARRHCPGSGKRGEATS